MPILRPFLGTVAALLAVATVRAQDPTADLPATYPERLCVKLAEGTGAQLQGGVLMSRNGTDLAPVAGLFARAQAEPLITARTWEQLDELHETACRKLPPHNRPGHLGLWFRLRLGSPDAANALLAELLREPLVAHAYVEPRPYGAGIAVATGDIPPTTPAFMSMQHSHEPSPVGHGVRLANGILGGRGRGVTFCMIEQSWFLDHEDVSKLTAANFIGPVPAVDPNQANHGVAGSSLMMADRNGYGLTGIATELTPKFLSIDLNGGVDNTMMLAGTSSQPGDVLMMVVMVLIPQFGPGAWLPIEFFQSTFDTALTLTSSGRILVVCAGNGNRSLDDPQLLRRFDRTFRDSGAIIVASSDAGAFARAPYSNWGSRIDAHSWGNQVVAAGYGNLFFGNNDVRQAYTDAYTGTSASTPHIAGILTDLQGAARRQLGHPLTLAQVQNAIHTYGAPTPDVIGLRPDLMAIFRAYGIVDGLTADAPEVVPGGTMSGTFEAPHLAVAGLFLSPNEIDVPIGWNRNLHIDPGFLISVGTIVATGTPAPWSMTLPNDPTLQGFQLYFQAARIDGVTGALELTNSCHVSVM